MKRFIAVFGVIVIITMHCLSFYPAKAAITSVDYGEMLNTYLGAAETAMALSQGANINWSNVELPDDSDTWTDQEKAQYIVSYIGNLKKVGQHAIYEWLFGEDYDTFDVVSAETAAIGLAKNSNIDTQDIKTQLDNILATQSQDHIFQRYSDKVIARWNEYNTNYINDYLDNMNIIENFIPVAPPDDASQSIQDSFVRINGSGFDFIRNLQNIDISIVKNGYYFYHLPFSIFSFYGANKNSNIRNYTLTNISTQSPIFASSMGIDDIYIVSNNDVYSVTIYNHYDNLNLAFTGGTNAQGIPTYGNLLSSGNNQAFGNYLLGSSNFTMNNSNPNYWDSLSYSGNLDGCFDFLSKHVKNVNIYVDGILYAQAGTSITSGLSISLPNSVIDSNTDDGKIVAHPIYYPDTMNTDKAIDIDLDKVIDAIASRIAQGADDITFDDIVDAGAAVKLDGTTLTDADTVVKDVSIPIARARVDTIDGVIPTIDVVPPLPPLPPLTPGDYSGEGFNGMSVLARIINATIQGLPEPLILTFFGVVFGAVILGIIKILHH